MNTKNPEFASSLNLVPTILYSEAAENVKNEIEKELNLEDPEIEQARAAISNNKEKA